MDQQGSHRAGEAKLLSTQTTNPNNTKDNSDGTHPNQINSHHNENMASEAMKMMDNIDKEVESMEDEQVSTRGNTSSVAKQKSRDGTGENVGWVTLRGCCEWIRLKWYEFHKCERLICWLSLACMFIFNITSLFQHHTAGQVHKITSTFLRMIPIFMAMSFAVTAGTLYFFSVWHSISCPPSFILHYLQSHVHIRNRWLEWRHLQIHQDAIMLDWFLTILLLDFANLLVRFHHFARCVKLIFQFV